MNRNDPVLLAALATMPLDDRMGIERQLAAIERRLEVIAAMLPGKPFAAVYLKAVGLLVRAIYESTHATRWYDETCRELEGHAARLENRRPR